MDSKLVPSTLHTRLGQLQVNCSSLKLFIVSETINNYTTTWPLGAFSLVVDRGSLEDTHRWRWVHVRSRQRTCFPFFTAPKNPSIIYCIKQIDYIFPCVCTVIGSFSKHDGNLNGDVLRNKRIVHTKQRERIISSPNGLINNVLVL